MTRRRAGIWAWCAIALVYVVGAMATGRLNPLERRPVLDGFAPPPPYRWVKPPAALAADNQKPNGGIFQVQLDPTAGSVAQVVTTPDAQVSVVVGQGSIAPQSGVGHATIKITPLAPASTDAGPGLSITGNVYRIEGSYGSGGQPVASLRTGAQLVLFYPAPLTGVVHKHVMVFSADGRSWTKLSSQDSPFQQQVLASITSFGYFAAASTGAAAPKPPTSVGKIVYYAVIIGVVALVVLGIIVSELRRRRTRGSGRTRPR